MGLNLNRVMNNYIKLMLLFILLLLITGCVWSDINPRPQDYNF